MTFPLRMLILLGVVSIAACRDDDAAMGDARSTFEVARQEIEQNTSDQAVPIQINDLPFRDDDGDPTATPQPI